MRAELTPEQLRGARNLADDNQIRQQYTSIPDVPAVREQLARYERSACTPRMVRNILERLGAASRSEIATWVARAAPAGSGTRSRT